MEDVFICMTARFFMSLLLIGTVLGCQTLHAEHANFTAETRSGEPDLFVGEFTVFVERLATS
jgi:hypothetical protein